MTRLRDANLEGSIGAAKALLSVVQRAKQKVQSVNTAGAVYAYTYYVMPADSTVSTFKTTYGITENLKENSLFETPFRITVGANYSTVTFFVPEENYSPAGLKVTPLVGGADVTVYSDHKKSYSNLTEEARIDRKLLYGEEVR
jgi:hypothetical protein